MNRRSMIQRAATLSANALLPLIANAQARRSASAAGFHYPDEAAPHARTFMQWPASRRVHDDARSLGALQRTIAAIANAIAAFEPVVMLAAAEYHGAIAQRVTRQVELWDVPTDDLWCRDCGPAFVVDGKGALALTQFNFNGWGNKQAHGNDGQIATRVAQRLGLPVFDAGLVGEPGGVEGDGHGTLIAHESSFVNPNRNRGSKSEVEAKLLQTMGARKVIWAPGIRGADITDYHIDALARFVKPAQVLIQRGEEVDAQDPWSVAAAQTHDILAAATDAQGRRLELVVLPEPEAPRVTAADFVASYVNYYVCNGAVIGAEFGDKAADREAARVLGALYPGRQVVMLNVDALGRTGGGIHCATQQQPRV